MKHSGWKGPTQSPACTMDSGTTYQGVIEEIKVQTPQYRTTTVINSNDFVHVNNVLRKHACAKNKVHEYFKRVKEYDAFVCYDYNVRAK